jgi:hypothetical protein
MRAQSTQYFFDTIGIQLDSRWRPVSAGRPIRHVVLLDHSFR